MGARVGNHAENARQGASKNGREEKLGYASLSKSIQGGVVTPFPLFGSPVRRKQRSLKK